MDNNAILDSIYINLVFTGINKTARLRTQQIENKKSNMPVAIPKIDINKYTDTV